MAGWPSPGFIFMRMALERTNKVTVKSSNLFPGGRGQRPRRSQSGIGLGGRKSCLLFTCTLLLVTAAFLSCCWSVQRKPCSVVW